MKEYKVIIKDEAETHLDEIYDYIAANLSAQIAAQKQTGRIRKAILNLNTLPYKFPCFDVEPYKSRGYRRMNVDNYAVFYIPDENNTTVNVVAVIYGKRDIEAVL